MKTFAAVLVAAAIAATSASAANGPALTVRPPGTIAGTGFPHRVRVVVTVAGSTAPARSSAVRSSATGSFSVHVVGLSTAPSCHPAVFTITARVAGRIRATIRFATPHSRDCAPPAAP